MADLYVTHGEVRWQEKGMAEPVRIIAPARLTLDEQSPHDLQTLAKQRPAEVDRAGVAGGVGATGFRAPSPNRFRAAAPPAWD